MLKEADFLTGFTGEFTSVMSREAFPEGVLRRRLLLVLFALGTSVGINGSPTAWLSRAPSSATLRPRCGGSAPPTSLATTCARRSAAGQRHAGYARPGLVGARDSLCE